MTSDVYPCLLTGKSEQHGYDCYQRNPLYCRAQDECLWELQALTRHYHPTVSLYAGTILQVRVVDCAAWLLVVLLLLSHSSSVSVYCGLCLGVGGVAVACIVWVLVMLLLLSHHYCPLSVSVCCGRCGLYCLGVGGAAVVVLSLIHI